MSSSLPQYLYKYSRPNEDRLLSGIKNETVWAENPNDFNDPFDCAPFIEKN
ncbi:hypothetical protein GCM10007868_11330 [Gluconobacter frateurii]|nr:hypothetical protein GCM10007868_11330 [Gluconobacter frateurii]